MVFWRERIELFECTKMSTTAATMVNANGTTSSFPTNGGPVVYRYPQRQPPPPPPHQSSQQLQEGEYHHQVIIQNRHSSPTKMPGTTTTVGGDVGGYPRCSCCPFGYHIDLDFINYCQSLGKVDPSPGQKLRRDRRRQRQSMEIMLGLGPMFQQMDTLQMLPKVGETSEIPTPTPLAENNNDKKRTLGHSLSADGRAPISTTTSNEKRLASAFANNALADVVQDFEKTLERSRTKSTSVERETSEERRRTFDSRPTTREKFFMEYEQHHGKSANLERNLSSYDNVDHMANIVRDKVSSPKDADLESVKSCASSGSEMSAGALQYIREQMATSLNKIRDLEEQNKLIPMLQRELARLKDDKRELESQIQENLQQEKRSLRSPFSPQRVSPVQLQATAFNEMMAGKASTPPKAILTREIGIQHTPVEMPKSSSSNSAVEVTQKLYTEVEVKRLVEEATIRDVRSVGCQMEAPKEECDACKVHEEDKKRAKKVISVPRGCQTETRTSTASVAVTAKPETRNVGSSEHTTADVICDRCKVRKRTIGCGTDAENVEPSGGPVSLKLLDRLTSKSKSDLTKSMEALMSTSQTSTSSIGTQMGNTMRDAGCQSTSVVLSNKSSQSDIVVVKGKATDTSGLVEVLDQASNTEMDSRQSDVEQAAEEKRRLAKVLRSKGTNTIGVTKHEQGTSTIQVRLSETAANTEPVPQRHVAVEVQSAVETKPVLEVVPPKHVTGVCEDSNGCITCKERIRELARQYQVEVPMTLIQTTTKVVTSPVIDNGSRIPRPSAMSPKTQRKPIAVLKRQDTYTVSPAEEDVGVEENLVVKKQSQQQRETLQKESEDNLERLVEVVEEPFVKRKSWVCGIKDLKSPPPDLISLGVDHQDYAGKDAVEMEIIPLSASIPPSDRPMSFVQELDESESAPEDEGEEKQQQPQQQKPILQPQQQPEPKLEQTTITKTTVLKMPKTSGSSCSIPEEEIRKELNLPRKPVRPSREMSAALKVINDSLMKSMDGHSLLNANTIVRREWFQVSSSESADGLDVEDYLDCFEEYSNHLLRYMVNLTDANGNTSMHYAVSHGNFDIVSILLDSKVCNVNQMNNAGYTCVMLVSLVKLIETAHRHVVQKLFQMSDVNIKAKKHNQTALMLAVSHGNLDMVQILLDAGADINIQDEDGSTALMCAAEHGKIDIVKLLLAQTDCDSSVQDVDGSTALKIALDAGYRDIGILLYAHDHMSRHRSPHSTLPRKSKLTAAGAGSSSVRYSPSASAPSSPAPSKKYFDHRK